MKKSTKLFNLKTELLTVGADQVHEKIEVDLLELNNSDYKLKYVRFKEVKFKKKVSFDDVNLSHGISFENSEFMEPLLFINVVVDSYDRKIIFDSVSIVFKNCRFSSRVSILGPKTKIQRSIVFDNCSFEDGLHIEGITVVVEGIKITGCTVHEKLDIFRSAINMDVHFSRNIIHSYIRLQNIMCSHILFTDANIVSGNLHISVCKLIQGIIFNDGTFKEDIDFSLNETQASGLTIISTTFEKSFTIKYHSGNVRPSLGISKYFISSAKFSNGLNILGVEDFFAERPRIKEINVDFSSLLIGSILFSHLDVGTLILRGYNTVTKLTLKHLHVNQAKVNGLINEGGLIFSNFRASKSEWPEEEKESLLRNTGFYIDDSNLGKAQFFQVNFQSFEKIVFHNLILTDISTSIVTWFTKAQLEDGQIAPILKGFKSVKKTKDAQLLTGQRASLLASLNSKKEIYRQLKFAAQKQGDIALSHEFQRHEMEYYKLITEYKEPKQWSEFLILWSSNSNNFGQSWLRAFWGLIFFSLISYIPIGFLTSDQLDYARFASSFDEVLLNVRVIVFDNFKSWFILLNPAHRINDLASDITKFPSAVYFWDILSRVVVAYFLFQMVSAFRKFSK